MTKGPALSAEDNLHDVVTRASRTIGRALQERRRELGLGQEAAADLVGVSRSTYTGYERDARRISPEVLRPLAHFLDIGVAEILELYGATCVFQARRILVGSEEPTVTSPFAGVRAGRLSRDDTTSVERVYFDTTPEKVSTVALATHDERAVHGGSPVALASPSDVATTNRKKLLKKQQKKRKKKRAEKTSEAKSASKAKKLTSKNDAIAKRRHDELRVSGESADEMTPTEVLPASPANATDRGEMKDQKKSKKSKKAKKTKKSKRAKKKR